MEHFDHIAAGAGAPIMAAIIAGNSTHRRL
jgi:hypothetical protein